MDGSPPPRVLHLRTVSGKGGGPEKTLLNSPRFLRGAYELRLAYIRPAVDPDYDLPARARRLGVDLVDIPERGPVDPRTLWRLAGAIRQFRPAILHAHDYKTDILAVLLGRLLRVPVVMTTLHGYVTRGGRLEIYYWLDRWALRRMDHVVAVSPDLHGLVAGLGIPPGRCSLVENAIDAAEYRRAGPIAAAKARLGLDPDRLVVGAVGRLSPEKGFDVLIRSAGRLRAAGLDVAVIIAGEGRQRGDLRALAEGLGLGDRVHLLGHRADTVGLYEAMDAFALSSLREGLPNALLEAMALEVPVVATRVAGVPRLVEDGLSGLLVDPGAEDDLTRALARLLGDPGLRARLGVQGRATVEARYSFEARMRKIRAIYDDLLGRASPGPPIPRGDDAPAIAGAAAAP
jgi:glycosyltransferase involved in cell wall biosynthesis